MYDLSLNFLTTLFMSSLWMNHSSTYLQSEHTYLKKFMFGGNTPSLDMTSRIHMQFPLNIVVAVVISAINVLISFGIKLSSKYKKQFRIYSVVVNVIFIVFLSGFSIFFKTSLHNQGINIYYDGLAILYFLLFIDRKSVV